MTREASVNLSAAKPKRCLFCAQAHFNHSNGPLPAPISGNSYFWRTAFQPARFQPARFCTGVSSLNLVSLTPRNFLATLKLRSRAGGLSFSPMAHADYHLKELVWFRGWTPTHWLLVQTAGGLTACCTRASAAPTEQPIQKNAEPVTEEMLSRIEKAVPGSLPALMGFEFVLCEGQPGAAVLNRPVKFSVPFPNPSEEAAT